METGRPGLWECLLRGARRRCPVCGRGRIFSGFLALRRDCPACRWVVEREPGTVTGSMYLVAIFTQIFAVALWLALQFTDWSVGLQLALALPLLAVLSLLSLPVSKGLWVGLEYYTDVMQGETDRDDYRRRAFGDDPDGGSGTA
jgi:uncharacterized protein (DUF983 family)